MALYLQEAMAPRHCSSGFTNQSNHWFKFGLANLLKPIIFPGESLYFLVANGNFFLFASNTRQEVIAVNFLGKTVRKIPPSPLGPRGTCSWRRSGMKLIFGSDHFRFMFAELVGSRPVLFVYASETDKWQSLIAREDFDEFPRGSQREGANTFLNVTNGPHESLVIAVGSECDAPAVVRPRFPWRLDDPGVSTVGFNLGNRVDRLYVYGDGQVLTLESNAVGDVATGARVLGGMELWSLRHGRWDYISKVPIKIIEKIKKPYKVVIGCLEGSDGIIRLALLSTFEGVWDIIWLYYDAGRGHWHWIPLPDSRIKGLNLAGIAFSSGLTLATLNRNC